MRLRLESHLNYSHRDLRLGLDFGFEQSVFLMYMKSLVAAIDIVECSSLMDR